MTSFPHHDTDTATMSVASDMTSDIATLDDLEFQQDHDQLPSVEEYKAQQTSTKVLGSMEIDQATGHVHDQLPNVEDYKAAQAGTGGGTQQRKFSPRKALRCFGITVVALVAMVAIIVVPLVILDQNREGGSLFGASNGAVSRESRVLAVANYLDSTGVSRMQDMVSVGSPQNRALKWIADDDDYQVPLPNADSDDRRRRELQFQLSGSTTHPRRNPFIERYSLAVLYYSLGGPKWDYQLRFLEPTHHCEWYQSFLTTAGSVVRLGVNDCKEVDGVTYVWRLGAPNNNLEGTFPPETQFFHRLDTLVMQFNAKITGTLPNGLSNLEYLKDLQLQYCSLTGTFPVWMGDIKTLTNLGLGNNVMTGIIPGEIGELTNLEVLGLDDNAFEGDIDIFTKLTSLKSMYLEDNVFTGVLKENMYESWPLLEELDLSANNLTNELPSTLFMSKTLVVLDVSKNFISGPIPAIEQDNTVLQFLSMYGNMFTETIPPSINKISSLKHLDLSKNKLVLPYPSELGDLTNLKYLFTGQNDFTDHPLPTFIKNLTLLRELSLKDSQLTGPIPDWIVTLSDMQLLDLGQNKLTGEIPTELGYVTGLDHLLLNRNELSGSLPDSLKLLTDLDLVLLDNNNFTGDTNVLCDLKPYKIVYLTADCTTDPATDSKEITCECCDLCCSDDNATCNNLDWSANLDPIWEYGYNRGVYSFSQELIPPSSGGR